MVYVISGAGSRLRSGASPGSPHLRWYADENGFTVHSFNRTHAQHTFVGSNGTTVHVVLRPLRSAAAGAAASG